MGNFGGTEEKRRGKEGRRTASASESCHGLSPPPFSLCFPESIFRFPFSFRSIAEEEEEDAKSFSLLLAFPRIVSKKNAAAATRGEGREGGGERESGKVDSIPPPSSFFSDTEAGLLGLGHREVLSENENMNETTQKVTEKVLSKRFFLKKIKPYQTLSMSPYHHRKTVDAAAGRWERGYRKNEKRRGGGSSASSECIQIVFHCGEEKDGGRERFPPSPLSSPSLLCTFSPLFSLIPTNAILNIYPPPPSHPQPTHSRIGKRGLLGRNSVGFHRAEFSGEGEREICIGSPPTPPLHSLQTGPIYTDFS